MEISSLIPFLKADGTSEMRSFPPAGGGNDGTLYCFVVSKFEFEQAREQQNLKVDDIFIWHKGRYAAIRALNDYEWEEAWHVHNIANPSLPNQLIVISSFSYADIFSRVQYPYIPPPDDWIDLPTSDIVPRYHHTIIKAQYVELSQEVKERLVVLWGSKIVQLSIIPEWLLDKYHWSNNVHLVVSSDVPVQYNLIK